MIKKFNLINYGSYQHFSWSESLEDFKKLNIFYGRNYSGKTTLSRILRSFELKKPHSDYTDSNFEIQTDTRCLTQNDIENNDLTIRVYNKDFMKDNLGFLIDDKSGDIKSFSSVIIGEQNKEIQIKIQSIKEKLGEKEDEVNNILTSGLYKEEKDLNEEKNKLTEYRKKIKGNLENKLRDKAREIKQNSYFVKQGTNYNINSILLVDIEKIKSNLSNFILSQEDKEQKESILKDEIKEILNFQSSFESIQFNQIKQKSKNLIETKIVAKYEIESKLRAWLNEGLTLHDHSLAEQECKFCKNTLNQERIQWLLENLKDDDKASWLKNEIKKCIEEIEEFKNRFQKTLENIEKIESQSFYISFQDEYLKLKDIIMSAKEVFIKNLEILKQKLKDKSVNIYEDIVFSDVEDYSYKIQENLDFIQNLCHKNNEKTKTLNADKEKARENLRLCEVAKFIKDISYFKNQSEIEEIERKEKDLDKKINDKSQEIKGFEKEILELENTLNDESAGANQANKYLRAFFGHQRLRFELAGNQKGKFKIYRDNEEAKNLSEGECSLLAFCYFVAKLQDKDTKDKKPIIWIDDPICSLDNNHIFFVYSLIESEISKDKNYTQLFISTHNLDFLQHLKSLSGFDRKNLQTPMFLIEKRKTSSIKKLPMYIRKYVTEFNYLFEQIYNASKQDSAENITLEIYYNLGNNIRKFLDSYLFFKYPNKESLMEKYEKFFQKDKLKANCINRIINGFSHLEEAIERSRMPMDLGEIQEASKIIIETIKQNDREQYEALKKSITS